MKSVMVSAFVLVVYLVPGLLRLAGQDHYVQYLLLAEDGLYESLGALACLIAGSLFLFGFFSNWYEDAESPPERKWWWLIFGVGLILMFLEETSWGQRILDFETPELIASQNVVGEANLHNLRSFYVGGLETNLLQAIWMLLVIGYLGVLPIVLRLARGRAARTGRWGFPLLATGFASGLWLNVGCFVATLIVLRNETSLVAGQQATELFEVAAQFMLLAVAIETVGKRWPVLVPSLAIGGVVAIMLVSVLLQTNVPFVQSISAIRKAEAHRVAGEHDNAITAYQHAIALWPRSALGHYGKAQVLEAQGNDDAAIDAYRDAIGVYVEFVAAHLALAMIHVRQGRHADAEAHAREAVTLEPQNADAWNLLGVAVAEQGNLSLGKEYFQRALAIDPAHAAALDNLRRARGAEGTPPQ